LLIGLFLKHIKAYKGINYIPVGSKYNFSSYIGENGVGKSSILEALDSYFNYKQFPINKGALNDGINTAGNEPFIAPIFLIERKKVTKQKKEFEKISNIFWNIEKKTLSPGAQGSMKEFFELRDQLLQNTDCSSDTHFLILAGEANLNATPKLNFASFQGEESFITSFTNLEKTYFSALKGIAKKNAIQKSRTEISKELEKTDWRAFHSTLKELYSYIYLPVEIEIESFTKIETSEMQKIFDKKLKDEIQIALKEVNFDNVGGINKSLDMFVSEIENILKKEYTYATGQKRNNSVTKSDLVNKILEVYFQKRTLHKLDNGTLTKVSELSAGEKRQALINLVYAFLKREGQRERMVIIGVDEPENSLHTALCYDQFEKLKQISISNQVLITTHWYGYLPIVSRGYGHFLNTSSDKISFESYDLFDYRSQVKTEITTSHNRLPKDFILKSTYDLVQSIFYSLKKETPYNWIICEGVSEKIYFEYFFSDEIANKNLRILPMGGQPYVIRLYRYLETPMNEEKSLGKVFCLVDTDVQRCAEIQDGPKSLTIRRLSNKSSEKKTELIPLSHSDTCHTDVEQALDPCIFQKTMGEVTSETKYHISTIEDITGNSSFHKNFKNLDVENYFKENSGDNKIIFAEKYIALMKEAEDANEHIPSWIKTIKQFFNG
jgi:predicted ATP-dependent endonuclease of OLD family